MRVTVTDPRVLWFATGDPVRAASAIAPLGTGWLIAQDDAIHGAWWHPDAGTVKPLRLLPPRRDNQTFSEADGTKWLKPDLETACAVGPEIGDTVLLLGSGSLPARMDGVLVRHTGNGTPTTRSADLTVLYERVRTVLQLDADRVNLEGACVVGERLRWFQRGHPRSGVPSASIDVDLPGLLAVFDGDGDPDGIAVGRVRHYHLGKLDGMPLAITDAVRLPDDALCVSATAEDAPDAVADGPITGSALAIIDPDGTVRAVAPIRQALTTCKVEGLAVVDVTASGARLLAVVDQDDPEQPSTVAHLDVSW